MPRSKLRNRLFAGLTKTANLISITIVVVASVLTFDWELLAVGLALEGVYLLAYRYWPSKGFGDSLKSPPEPDSNEALAPKSALRRFTDYFLEAPERSHVTFLDGVLLVVTAIGFVVILFFGFGKHLLNHPWPYLTHAEGWDAGAIIWTGFFLLYYTWKFPFTKDQKVDKAIISIIAWGSLPLLYLAGVSMHHPIKHVFYVWLIGVCFFVIDLLIWKRHPDKEERDLSRTSLLWADTPMVVAFIVLIGYLLFHHDTEHPDVFVSGVVSCQLLISNAVFIVTEFGLLHSPRTADE